MNNFLTLYTGEVKKINEKRRYKTYMMAVVMLTITCGILCVVTGMDYRMLTYPYEVLLAVKYVFAPIAVIIFAFDLAPSKINKVLAVLIMAVIIYLFKMFMVVYMASSILSVLVCGIGSVSLARILARYAGSFIHEAAAAAVILLSVVLIKKNILKRRDLNEEKK